LHYYHGNKVKLALGKEYFLPTGAAAIGGGGGGRDPKKYKNHTIVTSPSKRVCMLNNYFRFFLISIYQNLSTL